MEVMEFKGKGFSVEAEMIHLAEKHGFGNLGTFIALVSEKRPLFFFEKDLYPMKKFMLNKSISKQ